MSEVAEMQISAEEGGGEVVVKSLSVRGKIYEAFEDPVSSPVAVAIMVTLNCLILVSTTTFILETMPQMRDVEEDTWFLIETICIIGFTSDFVIRLLCCPDCGAFWGEFMNMVDFVAIVPYYVEFLIVIIAPSIEIPQYLRVIRVVRLARILRIIAMTKAGKMAAVIAKIAAAATQSLVVPAYFLFLCVIMYSSAMFYLEKGEYVSCEGMSSEWAAGLTDTALLGDLPPKPELEHHFCEGGLRKTHAWDAEEYYNKIFPSAKTSYNCDPNKINCCFCIPNGNYLDGVKYRDIPDAFWWVIVTVTTVGYGDLFPITWPGRGMGILTMMTGVFFLAMPLTIVGTKFNSAWEDLEHERHEVEEEEGKEQRIKKHAKLAKQAQEFVEEWDGFSNEYVGSSDAEKKELCDNRLNDLRRKQDALSADLVECFDLFHIGVQDINFTKEIDAAAEATAAGPVPEPRVILESE